VPLVEPRADCQVAGDRPDAREGGPGASILDVATRPPCPAKGNGTVRHLGIDLGTASVKLLLLGEDGYDVSVSRPVETLCRWC